MTSQRLFIWPRVPASIGYASTFQEFGLSFFFVVWSCETQKGVTFLMGKKLGVLFLAFASLFIATGLSAQDGGTIIRLDPALDALVSPDAHIEKLKDGFGFLEGPVWVHRSEERRVGKECRSRW